MEISDLLYLLVFLVIPLLNGVVSWYKEQQEKRKEGRKQEEQADEIVEADIEESPPPTSFPPQPMQPRRDEPPVRRVGETASPVPSPRRARPGPAVPPVAQPIPASRMAGPRPVPSWPPSQQPGHVPPSGYDAPMRPAAPAATVMEAIVVDEDSAASGRTRPRRPAAAPFQVSGESLGPGASDLTDSLLEDLSSPEAIRRAVVLSEILAPPVGIRGPGEAPFGRIQ